MPLEGNVVVIRTGLIQAMYAGAVWSDSEHALGGLTGRMQDVAGESRLFDIHISGREVYFKKQYEHRDYIITYAFNKQHNGVWIGEYSGTTVGQGIASCVVTEISEDLLRADFILEKLGVQHAHQWSREMTK